MAQKEKICPTRNNKLKVSKAWYYEWMMLNGCLARIKDYKNKDMIIYNALIEAFCVHLRNFIDFFHRKDKRPFWTDFLPEDKNIQLSHNLDKYSEKVNDLLSHLTYQRLKYTDLDKEWHIPDIANEVNENMFQFLDAADKSLLCDEIKEYRKQLRLGNKAQDNSYVSTTNDVVSSGTLVCARQWPAVSKGTYNTTR
jgi:hypothetical protein